MSEANETIIRVGRWWLSLEDGRRVPVVSGGSDASQGGDGGGAPGGGAPPADATTGGAPDGADPGDASGGAPPGSPAPEAGGGNEPPPWEGKTPEQLWNEREQAIKDRDKAKERFRPFEQALGGLHEDDAAFFTDFIGTVAAAARGDEQAATRMGQLGPVMRTLLDKMSPAQQQAATDAIETAAGAGQQPAGGGEGDFDPYDPKAIEQLVERKARELIEGNNQEAAQRRQVEEAREQMRGRATKLAEEHGVEDFGDPTSPLGRLLYITAHNQFGDEADTLTRLDKAAQSIVDSMGQAAQKLLKAKAADAGPGTTPPEAEQPSGQKRPSTFEEADKAALARLEQRSRGVTGT